MVTIAHRGASGYEPENTLASFKKALAIGVDGIELDVHLSKDGHVIVIHDSLVNRTTNGSGFVKNKTLSELKKLNAGNGERIPTLEEVFDLVNKRTTVFIELKERGTSLPVSKIIQEYVKKKKWKYDNFFVISFNHNELSEFKRLVPQVKIGAIIIGIRIQLDKYEKMGAYFVMMWSKLVRKSIIEDAHKRGLKVFSYTINTKNEAKRMKALGIDGIPSNYPDRIKGI